MRQPSAPMVLGLDDARATVVGLCGAKAANLAVATRTGMPTQPGFVVTTAAHTLALQATGTKPRRYLQRSTSGGST